MLSATAVNLIRADAWLNGTPLGTTRISHLARLDLAACEIKLAQRLQAARQEAGILLTDRRPDAYQL